MKHKPPDHLNEIEAAFWIELQANYAIDDAHGLSLLTLAAETLQRLREARQEIEKGGLMVDGRPNPLLLCERDCRKGFVSLMNALGLDEEPAGAIGRPTTSGVVRRIK